MNKIHRVANRISSCTITPFAKARLYLSRKRKDGDARVSTRSAIARGVLLRACRRRGSASIGLASHPPVVLHREDGIERNEDGSESGDLLAKAIRLNSRRGDAVTIPGIRSARRNMPATRSSAAKRTSLKPIFR